MLLQLDPPLPVLTPKGPGEAHVLVCYGREHHLQWVVFLDEDGQCWSFDNPDVRMHSNQTLGRNAPAPQWRPQWNKVSKTKEGEVR